ncbi:MULTISPECIES: CBS domain-containing protein [unclassified Solwaraspora]|uniref:CBS domain-containing protein n=1 Tax=unclassified Solwaraspora TaxID=2627926 RepID=UPI00248A9E9F|nr:MULTISPECIES: CBS domain-containing protein [unclassified Solwaraspora]WBB98360.1 CBS domain-containing protein [Solwaraspora sp. WMMA2059]WBC23087.1 CBS domain-containing protein [Solwaraspora sp. WMMA2080]WJK34878.1 CBS domain-containing protein [Solwaraspora sp. WMMA2065]
MTTVGEFMTARPFTMDASDMLTAAARQMRDADIGDIIVTNGSDIRGIVTDRDITVRAVASEMDPSMTQLSQIITEDVVVVSPYDDAVAAAELMRTYSVRRLPVVDDGRLVGVVSMGDLAVEWEPDSVLADISTDDPNN